MEVLIREVGESDADPKLILREVRASRLPKKGGHNMATEQPDTSQVDPLFVYAKFDGYGTPPDWALESRSISASTSRTYSIKWDKGWVLPIWSPEPGIPQESLWGWQWKRMSVVLNWPDEVKKSGTLFGLRELGLPGGGQADTCSIRPGVPARVGSAGPCATSPPSPHLGPTSPNAWDWPEAWQWVVPRSRSVVVSYGS